MRCFTCRLPGSASCVGGSHEAARLCASGQAVISTPCMRQEDPEWTAEKELCMRRGIPYAAPRQKENVEVGSHDCRLGRNHDMTGRGCSADHSLAAIARTRSTRR